jgi:hypothetical protein
MLKEHDMKDFVGVFNSPTDLYIARSIPARKYVRISDGEAWWKSEQKLLLEQAHSRRLTEINNEIRLLMLCYVPHIGVNDVANWPGTNVIADRLFASLLMRGMLK